LPQREGKRRGERRLLNRGRLNEREPRKINYHLLRRRKKGKKELKKGRKNLL